MAQVRLRLLLSTLWVGSLWTIGYLVAPTLFMTLEDRALAGELASRLFQTGAWVSMVCGVLLLLLVARAKEAFEVKVHQHLFIIIALMLMGALIGHFGLHPQMAALREAVNAAGGMNEELKARVGTMHNLSSGIYMMQSVLGLGLIFKLYQAKQ